MTERKGVDTIRTNFNERNGKNQTLLQAFEWYLPVGGHWNRLRERAGEFADAGFTTLWLPPAYKGQAGADDVGYGVYDTYDLGEFPQKDTVPTKYGTKDEYLAAIQALQSAGLTVLADVVLNHRMGADEAERVPADEVCSTRRYQLTGPEREVEAWTRFTFPGREGKYSSFQWDWHDFNGIDWDDREKRSAVYRFRGKDWNETVDRENNNFDYLMGANLDMSSAEVRLELRRWGRWYLDFTGVDGFRLDAVKHIRFSFFREWLEELRAVSGQELPSVGEYWSSDLDRLLCYLDECGHCASLFDVPLHFNLYRASQGGGAFDMGALRRETLCEAEPDSAVTFVDNHDTQPGQALESWVQGWFKPLAYSLILLQERGAPCVFWGDLMGIPHNGFEPVAELPVLLGLRQSNAFGEERPYFDHHDVVGLTRLGDAERPGLALLMSDGAGGEKPMYVGERFAGAQFHDALGRCPGTVDVSPEGVGVFRTAGGSASVWVP